MPVSAQLAAGPETEQPRVASAPHGRKQERSGLQRQPRPLRTGARVERPSVDLHQVSVETTTHRLFRSDEPGRDGRAGRAGKETRILQRRGDEARTREPDHLDEVTDGRWTRHTPDGESAGFVADVHLAVPGVRHRPPGADLVLPMLAGHELKQRPDRQERYRRHRGGGVRIVSISRPDVTSATLAS